MFDEVKVATKLHWNSRNDAGLKENFVYRDSWTRLNVKPAKVMQVCQVYENRIVAIIYSYSKNMSFLSWKSMHLDCQNQKRVHLNQPC